MTLPRSDGSLGSGDHRDPAGRPEPVGLLLINVGTPAAPEPRSVARYLRQFLGDPRVVDLPGWRRWLLVNLLIVPLRARRSAAAYRKIWSDRGSPLLVHSQELVGELQQRLGDDVAVSLGMRYGEPSITTGLEVLRQRGCRRVVLLPLFSQYTASATSTSLAEAYRAADNEWDVPYLQAIPPFFDHPAYLDLRAELARPHLTELEPERVFFSFHGIPQRQIERSDASRSHCLRTESCCGELTAANRHCYRAQCFAAAAALAARLELSPEKAVVCFQSRLGRTPWIRPYTDQVLDHAVRDGVRRAVIVSSFVTDCLETLEELGIRAAQSWCEAGGEELRSVPAPNADPRWAAALATIARDGSSWLRDAHE